MLPRGRTPVRLRGVASETFTRAPIPLVVKRRVLYTVRHRHLPRFRHPRTLSEKINWRILYDRRPLLDFTCDKLSIKEEAARLGISVPTTLWTGVDLREVAGLDLPDRWVLKPNHRSTLVYFGQGKPSESEIAQLRQRMPGWMYDYHSRKLGERAYRHARPLLLIEEMVGPPESPPLDFRLFTFAGVTACIQVDDSYRTRARRFYTPEWEPLEVIHRCPLAAPIPAPAGLDTMKAWAYKIAARFDFMRVDFYDVDGEVYLGELTPYPSGGLQRFTPSSFDLELGRAWTLPVRDLGSRLE